MNPCVPISIHNIAALVGKAYAVAFTPNNIMSGFRCTGIWPLNENIFSDDNFLGSDVSDQPLPGGPTVTPVPMGTPTADDAPPDLNQPSSEPQPSSSTDPSTTIISPEVVRPFPKGIRKNTGKGRKRGRTTHLTSTLELQALKAAKIDQEAKWKKPTKLTNTKKAKRVLFHGDIEDELLNLSDVQYPSASEYDFTVMSDDDVLEDSRPLGVGDFCVGKVA
ncbi:hypothetical protein GE061_000623 [Apolygus lucorum]|uniref:Uncharacterized protein n=1 Tax=Apolygus lucorum TaxID=248454 RepID=A0A8S9Y538_APOLU|nr:hypothetical protein GE061_000623 [Apolygus lucorum]